MCEGNVLEFLYPSHNLCNLLCNNVLQVCEGYIAVRVVYKSSTTNDDVFGFLCCCEFFFVVFFRFENNYIYLQSEILKREILK